MAKKTTVYYKPGGPFPGVSVPGVSPSVVIGRGESVVLEAADAARLQKALKADEIPGLSEENFEFVSGAEPEAEKASAKDEKKAK